MARRLGRIRCRSPPRISALNLVNSTGAPVRTARRKARCRLCQNCTVFGCAARQSRLNAATSASVKSASTEGELHVFARLAVLDVVGRDFASEHARGDQAVILEGK